MKLSEDDFYIFAGTRSAVIDFAKRKIQTGARFIFYSRKAILCRNSERCALMHFCPQGIIMLMGYDNIRGYKTVSAEGRIGGSIFYSQNAA